MGHHLVVMFIHFPLIEQQPKGLNYPSSWLGMNIQYEEDIFLSDKQDSSGSRPCWILRPIPRKRQLDMLPVFKFRMLFFYLFCRLWLQPSTNETTSTKDCRYIQATLAVELLVQLLWFSTCTKMFLQSWGWVKLHFFNHIWGESTSINFGYSRDF